VPSEQIDLARNQTLGAMRGLLSQARIQGRITLSGYEGSELLVARLLIECGAEVPYVGSACPATPWNAHDAAWLQAKGVHVQFRASLEQDIAAVREFKPQLAVGTTPVVQAAKEACIPSLYFTNLISARPLMGVAGVGSLIQVVQAAMGNQARFDAMKDFFGSVGIGDDAGVWQDQPVPHPEFKADMRRMAEIKRKKAKAEEMGS
jgi:chlorophyllide a reductase subunit Y